MFLLHDANCAQKCVCDPTIFLILFSISNNFPSSNFILVIAICFMSVVSVM